MLKNLLRRQLLRNFAKPKGVKVKYGPNVPMRKRKLSETEHENEGELAKKMAPLSDMYLKLI